MPSEKRARQRAAREARLAAQAKAQQRRRTVRNAVIVVVVAAVVIGIVFLVSGNNPKKPANASTTSTTLLTAQAKANQAAVAAGCPASTDTTVNKQHYSAPPAMTINTAMLYSATVKTTLGTFTMALDAKSAPVTVNNFVFLAKKGYYNCNIFHRVPTGFVDQTGDPTGTGTGSPGYKFANENIPTAYATGDVAMANSGGTDTNGSQFFIVVPGGANTLDGDLSSGGYSLFGRILTGQSVVNAINADGSASGTPPAVTQRMLSVTIHEAPPVGS